MAEWQLAYNYDYRYNALMISATSPTGAKSPVYNIRLSDLLRSAPVHEIEAALSAALKPYVEEEDVDAARRSVIEEIDFRGKSCIDLAGYDGSMAKIAVTRGCKNVKVVDSEQWRVYGWKQPEPVDGVQFIKSDLYDWTEPADVVVWYNCLYHVPDPMRALSHIRTLTKETMLLCSLVRYHEGAWMYVYKPREANPEDPSVYFGPSLEALERMLELTGWKYERVAAALDRCVYRCKPIPDFVDAETEEVRRASH